MLGSTAVPCTTFYIYTGDEAVFGRNYDWSTGAGLTVVNKRGMTKAALVGDDNPALWTSTYGSVTFNQYGRDFPVGGVNEKGLVVEVMWLEETIYPKADGRAAVGSLQWVQYILDTCSNVREALTVLDDIRIVDETARLHYLLADRSGGCAAVEFLEGEAVVSTGDADLPFRTLANSTYDDSLTFLGLYEEEGTPEDIAGTGSRERFTRAALRVNGYDIHVMDSATAVDYAADILDDVAIPDYSQWSIVYDVAGGRVYWRTLENAKTRWFDVGAFDFSPAAPVKVYDMNAPGGGDVTGKFADYTYEANRALIDAAFAGTEFLTGVSEEARENLARYPETTAPMEE
jgi:choloylglycine hydrolase